MSQNIHKKRSCKLSVIRGRLGGRRPGEKCCHTTPCYMNWGSYLAEPTLAGVAIDSKGRMRADEFASTG